MPGSSFREPLELLERFRVLVLRHQRLRQAVPMARIVRIFLDGFAICVLGLGVFLRLRIRIAEQVINFRRGRIVRGIRQNLHGLLGTPFVHQKLAQLFQCRPIFRVALQQAT